MLGESNSELCVSADSESFCAPDPDGGGPVTGGDGVLRFFVGLGPGVQGFLDGFSVSSSCYKGLIRVLMRLFLGVS